MERDLAAKLIKRLKTEYNKTAHMMAIEHEIWALRFWISAGLPLVYGGVEISRINAEQLISDLEEKLNELIANKKASTLKSTGP